MKVSNNILFNICLFACIILLLLVSVSHLKYDIKYAQFAYENYSNLNVAIRTGAAVAKRANYFKHVFSSILLRINSHYDICDFCGVFIRL